MTRRRNPIANVSRGAVRAPRRDDARDGVGAARDTSDGVPAAADVREELERARTARAVQVGDAHATSTRDAYRRDWARFEAWCERMATVEPRIRALPADDETLSLWVGSMQHLAPATVRRRLSAVKLAHERRGYALLDEALPATVAALRGHRRGRRETGTKARAPGRKTAATDALVQAMADACDVRNATGRRDRALLLLGWEASLRRSELVGVDIEHLAPDPDGLVLTLPFAKADQEGGGKTGFVRRLDDSPYCPVRAIREHLRGSRRTSGPLFVSLHTGRHTPIAGVDRLSAAAVGRIVQRAASRAGLPGTFSGHSLRRGHLTTALEAGVPITQVMQHARHASVQTTAGYDERRAAKLAHPDVGLRPDPALAGVGEAVDALPTAGPLALPGPLELATWTRQRPLLPDAAHFERHFGEAPPVARNTLVRVQRALLGDGTAGSARSERAVVDVLVRRLEPRATSWFERRLSDPAAWPSCRRAAALLGYLRALSQACGDPPSYTLGVAVELVDEDAALARGVARETLLHAPRLLLDDDVAGIVDAGRSDAYRLADTMLYLAAAQQAEVGHHLARHGIDPAPFDAMRAPPYERGIFQERFFAHLLSIGGDATGAAFAKGEEDAGREESLVRQIRAWRARDGRRNLSRANLERMIAAGLPAKLRAADGIELWTTLLWEQYEALLILRTMFEAGDLDETKLTALLERHAEHLASHRAGLDAWAPRPAFVD